MTDQPWRVHDIKRCTICVSSRTLFEPDSTDSPEAKHFLVWLHANGYTEIWHAYDYTIRARYRIKTGSSIDHMQEVSRVMADPWFGVKQ